MSVRDSAVSRTSAASTSTVIRAELPARCAAQTDSSIPALYGSRTRLIDEAGNEIGFSPLFHREPEFRSALVQSIAGGNTMVFNQKARELVVFCGADVDVPSHDWWLYQVTSACGGHVLYDAYPSVCYRQHAHNVVGANISWTARIHRLHMLQRGRFRHWEDLNMAALTRLRPRMSAENRRIFDLFRKARHEPLLRRATIFAQSGVYGSPCSATWVLSPPWC